MKWVSSMTPRIVRVLFGEATLSPILQLWLEPGLMGIRSEQRHGGFMGGGGGQWSVVSKSAHFTKKIDSSFTLASPFVHP